MKKNKKQPGGRPTKFTPIVVAKLEEAFALGCSDKEACFYADISKDALYDYQKRFPEFIHRKEALKSNPVLLARKTVIEQIAKGKDGALALRFLERRLPNEFSIRREPEKEEAEREYVNPDKLNREEKLAFLNKFLNGKN